jgi:hypothetical protein
MLVIGAAIGAVVPKAIDSMWPSPDVPAVSVVARQNIHHYRTYFESEPNWRAAAKAFEDCDRYDDPALLKQDSDSCRINGLMELGGIPELGGFWVYVTNPQPASVIITKIRSVVKTRRPASFTVLFAPPIGGPPGHSLLYNLDRDISEPVEIQSEGPYGPPDVWRPYFDTNEAEIPSGETHSFYNVAIATYEGIIEWHLELNLIALDADGVRRPMVLIAAPPSGPFVGAADTVSVGRTTETLSARASSTGE